MTDKIYKLGKYTPADRMKEPVPEDVKHERFNRLVEAVNKNSIEINKSYQDQVVEILVEGKSKNNDEYLQGTESEAKCGS